MEDGKDKSNSPLLPLTKTMLSLMLTLTVSGTLIGLLATLDLSLIHI